MAFNLKFNSLVTIVLLVSFSSFAGETNSAVTNAKIFTDDGVDHIAVEVKVDDSDLSFWDIPHLGEAVIDTAPSDRKDGIVVGKIGVDGGNKSMIVNLAQEIAEGQHSNYDSLLISHKGKLLFESYYSRGRVNLTHPQVSATKSYTGLALGRAIQLGYLSMADLDKPLVNFLKKLDATKFVVGVEKITLHQALTMQSGIRISKELKEQIEKEPSRLKGQRLVQAWLENTMPITEKSQSFKYGSDATLVMQVIDAVVPGTAKDFIENELLNKLGITTYNWQTSISGLPMAGARASITSRAMLKLGTLTMNKGKWNGQQLIPEAFIAKAIKRIITIGDTDVVGGGKQISNQGYGYYWWSSDMKVGDKSYYNASAQGGGGQYIILIEELDLMVVVTAHDDDDTLQLTAERILPAFIQNNNPSIIEKSHRQDTFSAPVGPYIGQKPPGLTPEVFAPGIVSTEDHEWGAIFSPDMKEFYFSRRNNKSGRDSHFVLKFEGNRWFESEVEEGMGGFIAPDGKTMFFTNQYREQTDNGWSELKSLGSAFEDIDIMRLTTSSKGTYVFDEYPKDGKFVLRYS